MHYEDLVPGDRGVRLREALLGALDRTYTENADRYDPDGIGDDATWFGLSVARNLWHVAEVATRDIEGVEGHRESNTFFLSIDGRYDLYFCKAPPGASSVHAVSFESGVRSRIIKRNGSHLQARLDIAGESTQVISDDQFARYAAIVHYGDPDSGFTRAEIGAPYLIGEVVGWEWHESFSDDGDGLDVERPAQPTAPNKPDAGDFGLVLIDPARDAKHS